MLQEKHPTSKRQREETKEHDAGEALCEFAVQS